MEISENTNDLFKRFEGLRKGRANWETHWDEIAERVLPRSAEFTGERTPGDKRTQKLYDATAVLALERFASAVESLLTPRGATWHTLRANNPTLNADDDVRLWFDHVNELLFQTRYSPKANFASQMHESYMSLGAFGTGGMFVDEDPVRGMRYRAIHLADLYLAQDEQGTIDTVFRKFEVTARQAMRMFNDEDLSSDLRKEAEDKPDTRVKLLHVVMPRTDRDVANKDRLNAAWFSGYFEVKTKHLIVEGGFDDNPYILSRYVTGPRETYGRSPAMTVLPEIKMINEMSKTVIRAGQKIVDPPLLIADDGVVFPVNTTPGGTTFARLDGRQQSPVQPLHTGARVDIGFEMMEQRRKQINDAFLVTLFQILVETPSMTATEVLQRAQEKGALLAPTMGRQQSESLGPLINRELNILSKQGVLPPPPELLVEAEGEYEVEYVSPLSRAMKAEEGIGILRTLEMVQPIAAMDQSVMDNFDFDEITRILADTNGAPQKILRRSEEVEDLRQQRDQQQQMAAMMQAAPGVADTAETVAGIAQQAQQ
jgi:hypothetical protein|tara:strand:- start:7329 stop:8951 length:1623 start_codon:yes stop_codon:yes gene_type:complete